MQLNDLKKIKTAGRKKTIGRGGKRGTYSGKGIKGQKARAGHRMRPELRDIIKKLHKKRGFGIHRADSVRSDRKTYTPVSVGSLERFSSGAEVTPKILVAEGVISGRKGRRAPVKILHSGKLTKKLLVSGCSVSAGARKAIEAAGGTIKS